MKKIVLSVIALVAAGVAALLYASPYMALNSIKQAIDSKDSVAIAEYVDFPVLRENIKGRLMASMTNKLPETSESNPLAGLGQAIGNLFIGTAVDNLVSPAGVMLMLQTGKPSIALPRLDSNQPSTPAAAPASPAESGDAAQQAEAKRKQLRVDYQGFNKVRVYRQSDPATGFIFKRYGLMDWKLINIDLP